ncbi:hypothetical protein PMIN03_003694 [Paraphaeosphaeria minitans]
MSIIRESRCNPTVRLWLVQGRAGRGELELDWSLAERLSHAPFALYSPSLSPALSPSLSPALSPSPQPTLR